MCYRYMQSYTVRRILLTAAISTQSLKETSFPINSSLMTTLREFLTKLVIHSTYAHYYVR